MSGKRQKAIVEAIKRPSSPSGMSEYKEMGHEWVEGYEGLAFLEMGSGWKKKIRADLASSSPSRHPCKLPLLFFDPLIQYWIRMSTVIFGVGY